MATGIAVRFVDGLLRDKHRDPAVVVLDEAGRYAIALVGGHEGGANALAYRVASAVGATPVVTTATEAAKSLVVGIGCRKGVSEEQIERAVLHALGLRGVAWRQEQATGEREGAGGRGAGRGSDEGAGGCGAGRASDEDAGGRGAGRRSDEGGEGHAMRGFAVAADLSAVREIATIDLKAEEPGLVAFSRRRGIPLRIIARHQIVGRPWVSKPSAWVREALGVEGVCEPCALIASIRGRLVVPKATLDGVAVAIVDDEWELGS